jgi:hypothetical protein
MSTLAYWLEIEEMALQMADGQTGEAAMAAADGLIKTLPRSAVFARYVGCTIS